MTITLPPEYEQFVQEKLASGQYNTPQDILMKALDFWKDHEEKRQQRLEALRREIHFGLDDEARGDVFDGPSVIAELRAEARQANGESP